MPIIPFKLDFKGREIGV